jgi:hypothetical protein
VSGIIVMPLFIVQNEWRHHFGIMKIVGGKYNMNRIRKSEERQLISAKSKKIRVSYTVTSRTFVCQTSHRHKGFVAEILGDAPNTPNERMVL